MNELFSSIFDAVCVKVQFLVTTAILFLTKLFTGKDTDIGLNLTYFKNNLFVKQTDSIFKSFQYIGGALTLVFFFFFLIFATGKDKNDSKDTTVMLIRRLIVTFVAIMYITNIFDQMMLLGNNLLEKAAKQESTDTGYTYFGMSLDGSNKNSQFDSGTDTSSFTIQNDIESIVAEDSDATRTEQEKENWVNNCGLVSSSILKSIVPGSLSIFYILILIVRIIFYFIIAYNFLKLCVEYLRRYITMCTLYMMAPTFSSFFISSSTQLVFFSYFKMFGVSILVLILSKIWIFLSAYLMSTVKCSFVNMCLIIAFINVGVRMEMLLKELGLTTASMGGALLDNIAVTAGAVGAIGKSMASKGLINAGAVTGNVGLATAGSVLAGKPLTPEGVFKTMSDSAGGVVRENVTRNSSSSNMTSSQKDLVNRAMASSGMFRNPAISKMYQSLNAAGKQEMMSNIMGNSFKEFSDILAKSDMSISNMSYDNKGFNFDVTGSNGVTRAASISDTPMSGPGVTSIRGVDANGKPVYLNMQSGWDSLQNKQGTTFVNRQGDLINGTSKTEMETGVNMSPFIQNNDMDASHYFATMNEMGNMDIKYGTGDIEDAEHIGTVTSDGQNLFKGNYDYGEGNFSATHINDDGTEIQTSDIPFEAEFALQFAHKGDIVKIDCLDNDNVYHPQTFKAEFDGEFANLGRANINGVECIKDGMPVKFENGKPGDYQYIKFRYDDTTKGNKDDRQSVGYVSNAINNQMKATRKNTAGKKETYGTKIIQ